MRSERRAPQHGTYLEVEALSKPKPSSSEYPDMKYNDFLCLRKNRVFVRTDFSHSFSCVRVHEEGQCGFSTTSLEVYVQLH